MKLVINQCVFLSSLTPRLWNMQNMSRCVSWGPQILQIQWFICNSWVTKFATPVSHWYSPVGQITLAFWEYAISTCMTYRLCTRARLWKNFRPWLISQLHLQHWILGPVMFHMTGSSTCFPMQLPTRFDFCWWFSHLLFVSHVARQRRMLMWTLHLLAQESFLSSIYSHWKSYKGTANIFEQKKRKLSRKRLSFFFRDNLYLHLNESDS